MGGGRFPPPPMGFLDSHSALGSNLGKSATEVKENATGPRKGERLSHLSLRGGWAVKVMLFQERKFSQQQASTAQRRCLFICEGVKLLPALQDAVDVVHHCWRANPSGA